MESKKLIIQYIDQLFDDELDQYEFSSVLAQFKKRGSKASDIILDLIQTAESDKKRFLFHLLGEIGDQKTVARLKDIITNPDQDDETKLMAAVTSSQIDGHFDTYLLENHLTDPQELGKKVIEDMLDKSDNPFFLQVFLENFPRINREGQYTALEDLLPLKGDERVINIVGPLIELVDDELLDYIISILTNSHDSRAFEYLQQIIKKTKSKEIQNQARQAIFKLGTFVKENRAAKPQYKFHQAFATTSDGSGSSIYIFSVIDNDGKVRFLDFVNNDFQGIKDAFGGIFMVEDFDRFIKKLKAEKGFLTVKVPPTLILEKVKLAEELTKGAHRTLPIEYLTYQSIFKDLSYEDKDYENIKHNYAEFKKQVHADSDDLLDLTENLYDYEEVSRSWFIDYELMAEPVDRYITLEMEHGDSTDSNLVNRKIDKLIVQTAKRLLKKDFLSLLTDRLNDYAFLSFIGKKKGRAKLAIVAAETLFSFPPEEHPFLKRLVEHSFEVYLYEEDFLDEDEFEEFDDWDVDDKF